MCFGFTVLMQHELIVSLDANNLWTSMLHALHIQL